MIDVTQLYCPGSGAAPGEDNSTHHLVPRGRSLVCRGCGKGEHRLRIERELHEAPCPECVAGALEARTLSTPTHAPREAP